MLKDSLRSQLSLLGSERTNPGYLRFLPTADGDHLFCRGVTVVVSPTIPLSSLYYLSSYILTPRTLSSFVRNSFIVFILLIVFIEVTLAILHPKGSVRSIKYCNFVICLNCLNFLFFLYSNFYLKASFHPIEFIFKG